MEIIQVIYIQDSSPAYSKHCGGAPWGGGGEAAALPLSNREAISADYYLSCNSLSI